MVGGATSKGKKRPLQNGENARNRKTENIAVEAEKVEGAITEGVRETVLIFFGQPSCTPHTLDVGASVDKTRNTYFIKSKTCSKTMELEISGRKMSFVENNLCATLPLFCTFYLQIGKKSRI